jgi:XTP/dITP diphosphohydrolase
MEILFASNNAHKVDEVRAKLAPRYTVRSLREVVGEVDIPETGTTLEENAALKARYLHQRTGMDCFADDTGLEITALHGEPGVYSARYAGEGCSFDDNMDKVLRNLHGHADRSARFRTVICLIHQGKEYFFEGEVKGELLTERVGQKGFGYDPIFRPEGFQQTFAQMTLDQKNTISHRGLAVEKLAGFLAGV